MPKTYRDKQNTETQAWREKMAINKYLSILTLNVNGLNAPMKRHSIAEWIRKHDPQYAVYKGPTSEQKIYTR